MDEKIKNLWQNNKILFFLLLPLILVVVFKDVIIEVLLGSARKMSNEAKDKDADLKAKQDEANAKANQLKAEADALGKKVEDGNATDESWNKDWKS